MARKRTVHLNAETRAGLLPRLALLEQKKLELQMASEAIEAYLTKQTGVNVALEQWILNLDNYLLERQPE